MTYVQKDQLGRFMKGGGSYRTGLCGEKSPNWKGGKPKCFVCGKQLSGYGFSNCSFHRKPKSEETRKKLSIANTGKKHTKETREKMRKPKTMLARQNMSIGKTGKRHSQQHIEAIKSAIPRGPSHYLWKVDRMSLAKKQERNDSAYANWRKSVWMRDDFMCRIADTACSGRIEAHHILGWIDHPELRYQINNGITLCHAHHPRKRSEEKRLIPTFQELVSVSKV